MKSKRLYHVRPRVVEWKSEDVGPSREGHVLVRTTYSAISAGTELLFFRGDFHTDLSLDSKIDSLSGQPRYPFRYGYCLCGEIVDVGSSIPRTWIGRQVFSFRAHESLFWAKADEIQFVPETIGPKKALFFPNFETAVNLVLDVAPTIGERIAVYGQGVVGLLTTHLLSRFPLQDLVTYEPIEERRRLSLLWGANSSHACPQDADFETFDTAIELSGNPVALDRALRSVQFSGRVVVGSWYGRNRVSLDLGGSIHRSRIQFHFSQVSTISPHLSGRWDRERRTRLTWEWLRDVDVESLISHTVELDDVQNAFERLDRKEESALKVVLRYE